jgi:hypothetical protein
VVNACRQQTKFATALRCVYSIIDDVRLLLENASPQKTE